VSAAPARSDVLPAQPKSLRFFFFPRDPIVPEAAASAESRVATNSTFRGVWSFFHSRIEARIAPWDAFFAFPRAARADAVPSAAPDAMAPPAFEARAASCPIRAWRVPAAGRARLRGAAFLRAPAAGRRAVFRRGRAGPS